MADLDELSYFQLEGTYRGIIPDTFDPGMDPDFFNVWCDVTLGLRVEGGPADSALELRLTAYTPPQTVLLVPVRARIETGVLKLARLPAPDNSSPSANEDDDQREETGVRLLAKSETLGIGTAKLLCDVKFGTAQIHGQAWKFSDFTFEVPTVDPTTYTPNRVQTITVVGGAGGSFKLRYGSQLTAAIPNGSTGLTVQGALRALTSIGSNVDVAGAGPYTATFTGPLARTARRLYADTALLTPPGAKVNIADTFAPTTIDLTTVTRYVAPPA